MVWGCRVVSVQHSPLCSLLSRIRDMRLVSEEPHSLMPDVAAIVADAHLPLCGHYTARPNPIDGQCLELAAATALFAVWRPVERSCWPHYRHVVIFVCSFSFQRCCRPSPASWPASPSHVRARSVRSVAEHQAARAVPCMLDKDEASACLGHRSVAEAPSSSHHCCKRRISCTAAGPFGAAGLAGLQRSVMPFITAARSISATSRSPWF